MMLSIIDIALALCGSIVLIAAIGFGWFFYWMEKIHQRYEQAKGE